MLRSATLLGSSSGRNAGDAALIAGLMEATDEACGARLRYEVPTIRPSYIRDHYPNSDAVPVPMLPWNLSVKMLGLPTYRSVMRSDLTLVFDAILFDRSLYNPLFNFMSTLALLLPRARRRGKRMGFYNVGAGPVNTPAGRAMLVKLADMMDFITVRDEDSYRILKEIGVGNPRILVGADAALNVRASGEEAACRLIAEAGLDPAEEFLAVNVNTYMDTWAGPHIQPVGRERFLAVYAEALNRVGRELGVPVLFVCTQHHDVPITRELMARLDVPGRVAMIGNVRNSHYDVKAALGRADLLFGMRLHSLILASSELTPVVGIAYQPKVAHYFASLGLPEYSLGFEDFTPEALAAHVLRGWRERGMLRERLRERIPRQQAKARKAAELVAALHRGEDLDTAFTRIARDPEPA